MSDKKSSESRRKLLKSIAAGSGAIVAGKSLPENWKKPVVDSVLLPAHAQTSPVSGNFSANSEPLQTTLCINVVGNTASITGTIGNSITIPNVPVPGSTSGSVSGTNYTITLSNVTGTAPNRSMTVGLDLSGSITGTDSVTAPEVFGC